jgi:hypothetical protein
MISKVTDAILNHYYGHLKQYLEETGSSSFWEIMGEYNHLLADTPTKQENGEPRHKGSLVFIDKMRLDTFKKWAKSHNDNGNYLITYNPFTAYGK